METLKRTPLFEAYREKGKVVSFHGWEMPVQFSGIMAEHAAVRNKAGIFDVSHMGEIQISGPAALPFIQRITTNDASLLAVGEAQYSVMCYPDGGSVDDLLVYRVDEESYLLVINASNIEKDEAWMREHQMEGTTITNVSDETVLLALQGPLASNILEQLLSEEIHLKPFEFMYVDIKGAKVLLSRTGYTGEDGFELYFHKEFAVSIWDALFDVGTTKGLIPCGLGARDTLRLEARMCLYGQELTSSISPIEAGIAFAVKFNKGDFIGRDALLKQKEEGPLRKIVGIQMMERGIPRSGYPIYKGDKKIGMVTSGTHSPTLKKSIGLALLDTVESSIGETVEVEIRGKKVDAQVMKTPFYKRSKGKVTHK